MKDLTLNICSCCKCSHLDDNYIYSSTHGGILCIICTEQHLHATRDHIQLIKIAGKGTVPLLIYSTYVTIDTILHMIECKKELTKIHQCVYSIKYIHL